MSISEFFHMGGYAFYVWTSYLLTVGILVVNLVMPWMRERHLLQRIARRARRRSA